MPELLNDIEEDALEWLYGGGDEEIECRSVAWVVTRYPQKCVSILHKGPMTQSAGSRMANERAKVEGRFGSCYTCEACIQKAIKELEERT